MTVNENEVSQMTDDVIDGPVLKQGDIEVLVADATGVSPDVVKQIMNTTWDEICDALESGQSVQFHGKGKFYLSHRSARIGRNPLTGDEYTVPAREAMAWQTSPAYAKRLRERRDAVRKYEK